MKSRILRVSCKVNVKPEGKGFTLILQETRSIYDFMNIPKIEFIAYLTISNIYKKYVGVKTAKLLKQGYRYHKIRKAFSKFYHRHSELIVKYNIGLKTLPQQGISEPIFYDDLVYDFKRIVGKPNFSDQFKKIVKRYIRVGYN